MQDYWSQIQLQSWERCFPSHPEAWEGRCHRTEGRGLVMEPTWLLGMRGNTGPLVIMVIAIAFFYVSATTVFHTWYITFHLLYPLCRPLCMSAENLSFLWFKITFFEFCLINISSFLAELLVSLWISASKFFLFFLSFTPRDIILHPTRSVGVSCFGYWLIHSSCGSVYITLLEESPDGDVYSSTALPHPLPTLTAGPSVYEGEQYLETSTLPSH